MNRVESRFPETIETYLRQHWQLWLALLAIATFVLVTQSAVTYTDGDSKHVLVTTQAILEAGTIRLDDYVKPSNDPRIIEINGHLYDYQPLGTSLFAIPVVWIQLLRGESMVDIASNQGVQNTVAGIIAMLCCILIFLQARLFVSYTLSFVLTITFVLGSSIASTVGTALANHGLAILCGFAVVLIIAYDSQDRAKANPYLLATLLFVAFLARPTMAALAVAVLIYMLLWRRPLLLGVSITLAGLIGLFLLLSWREFGQPLPFYYQFSRIGSGIIGKAVYGHLFSPGRGLFIYSPFLILTVLGLIVGLKRIVRLPLFWLAFIWIVLFLSQLFRWWNWWGGWSFGSRLMMDILPALLLLTLIVWQDLESTLSTRLFRLALAILLVLSGSAIFIHTLQGLNNPYTREWNVPYGEDPDLRHVIEDYALDWRYPQFLANPEQIAQRNVAYSLADALRPVELGQNIQPGTAGIQFDGWYGFDANTPDSCRWSQGTDSALYFTVEPEEVRPHDQLILDIHLGTHQAQAIDVLLNNSRVGSIVSKQHWQPETYTFLIQKDQLRLNKRGNNELRFLIPNAISPASVDPNSEDTRELGLCLWHFGLRPASVGSDGAG